MCTKFLSENWKGRDHLRNLGIDVMIILRMNIEERVCEDMDRISLALIRFSDRILHLGYIKGS
jgi:hypothetical protein